MKYFSLIYQGEVHPADDEKVIPAKDFSILASAQEIVKKAKEDAAELKRRTEEECAHLKEKAKEEGKKEGLFKFNEQIIHSEQEIRRLRHDLQQQVLPLALKAAQKIVGKELELHPDTIVDIILQALRPVVQNQRFTIYVSKEEKETVEAHKPRIKDVLEQVQSLHIRERGDIAPGGCIIETETGIINASVENQWRALESAFERYMKKRAET